MAVLNQKRGSFRVDVIDQTEGIGGDQGVVNRHQHPVGTLLCLTADDFQFGRAAFLAAQEDPQNASQNGEGGQYHQWRMNAAPELGLNVFFHRQGNHIPVGKGNVGAVQNLLFFGFTQLGLVG